MRIRYFNSFCHSTFAKTGDVATETVVLDKGPLSDFPFALESRLRSLGLYTRLKNGVIELEKDHVVCEEGKELTTESAQLLVSVSFTSSVCTYAAKVLFMILVTGIFRVMNSTQETFIFASFFILSRN